MNLKALTIAAVIAVGASLAPQMASAASLPAAGAAQSAIPDSSMLHEVGRRHWHHGHRPHFNRCRVARHVCADRFGWGSLRFRRCVAVRGCVRW